MSRWPMVELGTFCEAKLGKALNARANEGAQAWPYLRNVNVQWGRVDLCDVKTMHFTERERSVLRLQRGDLLVCEGGEVGRAAIWEGEIAECYFQNALHRLRPDQARCLTEYLFYQMLWKAQTDGFREFTTRATIAHLSGEKLARVPIPLPPLEEQRRIVDVLNRAAGIRRLREAALAKARDTIPALFLSMFGDPATNPKGWPSAALGSFAAIRGGKRLQKGSQYSPVPTLHPYVRAGDIKAGVIDMSDLRFISPELHHPVRRYVLSRGSCVITIAGKIGAAAAVPDALEGANLTENAARIEGFSAKALPDFLASELNSPACQQQIVGQTGQVTIGKLALERLCKIDVRLPPLPLQQEFAARLADLRGIIAQAERALGLARETERALMAHLLG